MSDEEKAPEAEVPTIPENMEQIDRTEYERLKTNDERLTRLDELAGEQFGTAEDYIVALEDSEREHLEKQQEPAKKPPATQPVARPQATAPATPEMDQRTLDAIVRSHRTEFRVDQRDLPEDQRSTYSEAELMKVCREQGPLVARVSVSVGGNMFAAATKILNVEKGTVAKAVADGRAEGAATEKVKSDAAASMALPTGGGTPLPKTDTPEEQAAAKQKAELDRMIPDDPTPDFGQ